MSSKCPFHRILSRAKDQRGYPIPFFVANPENSDTPDFRIADGEKKMRCLKEELCWVCGEKLGINKTFVIGPMCGVNRTTSEPPCHLDCARYSAMHCPFLSQPRMKRNEKDLPEDCGMPGIGIKRNPGVTLLWTTEHYRAFVAEGGGILVQMGKAKEMEWYKEGRIATFEEISEAVTSGVPVVLEQANVTDLEQRVNFSKLCDKFLEVVRQQMKAEVEDDSLIIQ